MKSEISWKWLDNFRKFTYYWLTFWRGIWKILPDSFNKKWLFFWKNIGYGLPSSSFLINRMLKYVDWKHISNIVELWWWTWVTTRAILKRKIDKTLLTSCEIEKFRFDDLKKYNNHHTKILHMDAEACLNTMKEGSVEVVISTLPLWSMNPIHAREILAAAAKSLSQEGLFIQYQYFATNKDDIEKYFTIVGTDWEPINFPPAFIYICKKK